MVECNLQVLISREHEARVSDVELNEHATVSHIGKARDKTQMHNPDCKLDMPMKLYRRQVQEDNAS